MSRRRRFRARVRDQSGMTLPELMVSMIVAALILSAFSQAYTDLPVETAEPLEGTRLAAAGSEQTIRALQEKLREKEQVIRDLDRAARERLALIEKLSAALPR